MILLETSDIVRRGQLGYKSARNEDTGTNTTQDDREHIGVFHSNLSGLSDSKFRGCGDTTTTTRRGSNEAIRRRDSGEASEFGIFF